MAALMLGAIEENDSDSPKVAIQIFFALIGKMMASATFQILYVYTVEVFPTSIRNTAIGSCSCIARFGAILSFFLRLLKDYVWKPAPILLMGTSSLVGGFLALCLPETIGNTLPETIEDCLHIGEKNSKRGTCTCKWPLRPDNIPSRKHITEIKTQGCTENLPVL